MTNDAKSPQDETHKDSSTKQPTTETTQRSIEDQSNDKSNYTAKATTRQTQHDQSNDTTNVKTETNKRVIRKTRRQRARVWEESPRVNAVQIDCDGAKSENQHAVEMSCDLPKGHS